MTWTWENVIIETKSQIIATQVNALRAILSKQKKKKKMIQGIGQLVGFYGISTAVGYLIPNPLNSYV